MNPKIKQKRARSEEQKAAQFEIILEEGQKLFLEKGRDGFSLRSLGKTLGMNKNNLYNYVKSKRELWIAIRNKFYNEFKAENIEIIKEHKGTTSELLLKIFEHFLEFYENDFGKFLLMHNFRGTPPSNKIGPFEKKYREFRLLEGTTKIIQKAIDDNEISHSDATKLSFLLYALLMGSVIVEYDMKFGFMDPTQETIQYSEVDFTITEFRKYALEMIKKILKILY